MLVSNMVVFLEGLEMVREVDWKNFFLFSSKSDLMILNYDQKRANDKNSHDYFK